MRTTLALPAIRILSALALSSLLASCTLPGIRLFGNDDPERVLAPGESTNVHFFTSDPSFDTDVGLVGGSNYEINIAILSNWIDKDIEKNENDQPLDELGFANSVMPFEILGATRRSRAHQWFELMLSQSRCPGDSLRGVSDLNYDESSESYRFTASCNGELTLHVNDALGFYANNLGYANISIERLN